MVIKRNKLQQNNKKKNQKLFKLNIIILSETENENYYLIEIQKSYQKFKKGESFLLMVIYYLKLLRQYGKIYFKLFFKILKIFYFINHLFINY